MSFAFCLVVFSQVAAQPAETFSFHSPQTIQLLLGHELPELRDEAARDIQLAGPVGKAWLIACLESGNGECRFQAASMLCSVKPRDESVIEALATRAADVNEDERIRVMSGIGIAIHRNKLQPLLDLLRLAVRSKDVSLRDPMIQYLGTLGKPSAPLTRELVEQLAPLAPTDDRGRLLRDAIAALGDGGRDAILEILENREEDATLRLTAANLIWLTLPVDNELHLTRVMQVLRTEGDNRLIQPLISAVTFSKADSQAELRSWLASDSEADRESAARILSWRTIGPESVAALRGQLEDTSMKVRLNVAFALYKNGSDDDRTQTLKVLRQGLAEPKPNDIALAARLLGNVGKPAADAADDLRKMLANDDEATRVAVAGAIWQITEDTSEIIAPLMRAASHTGGRNRWLALSFLAQIAETVRGHDTELLPVFAEALRDPLLAWTVTSPLAKMGKPAVERLSGLLADDSAATRKSAAEVLGNMKDLDEAALSSLANAVKTDVEPSVRLAALSSLTNAAPESAIAIGAYVQAVVDRHTELRQQGRLYVDIHAEPDDVVGMLLPLLNDADTHRAQYAALAFPVYPDNAEKAVAALYRGIAHQDDTVRYACLRAVRKLRTLPDSVALRHSIQAFTGDNDPLVAREAKLLALRFEPPVRQFLAVYRAAVNDGDPNIVAQGTAHLSELGESLDVPKLLPLLDSSDETVVKRALDSLESLKESGRPAAGKLLSMLKGGQRTELQSEIAWTLKSVGIDATQVNDIIEVLPAVAEDAKDPLVMALSQLGDQAAPALSVLRELLEAPDSDKDLKTRVCKCLGEIGPTAAEAVPELRTVLLDRNSETELLEAALEAIGMIGKPAGLLADAVAKHLEHDSLEVQQTAANTLPNLGDAAHKQRKRLIDVLRTATVPQNQKSFARAVSALGPDANLMSDYLELLEINDADVRVSLLQTIYPLGSSAKIPQQKVLAMLAEPQLVTTNVVTQLFVNLQQSETSSAELMDVVLAILQNKAIAATVRNIAVMNLPDNAEINDELAAVLVSFLSEADPWAKLAGATALVRQGRELGKTIDTLVEVASPKVSNPSDMVHFDGFIRSQAIMLLGEIGPDAKQAVDALFTLLGDPASEIVNAASGALVKINTLPTSARVEDVAPMLDHRVWGIRQNGATLLALFAGQQGNQDAANAIISRLNIEKNTFVKRALAQTLASLRGETTRVLSVFKALLDDPDQQVQVTAAQALGAIGPDAKDVVHRLLELSDDASKPWLRDNAIWALGQIRADADNVVPQLITKMETDDASVRAIVEDALVSYGREAVDHLVRELKKHNAKTFAGSARCLGRIGIVAADKCSELIDAFQGATGNDRREVAAALTNVAVSLRASSEPQSAVFIVEDIVEVLNDYNDTLDESEQGNVEKEVVQPAKKSLDELYADVGKPPWLRRLLGNSWLMTPLAAVAVILFAGLLHFLGSEKIRRGEWIGAIVTIGGSGAVTTGSVFETFHIHFGGFVAIIFLGISVLLAAGFFNASLFRHLATVAPFDSLLPMTLTWPRVRKQLFIEYLDERLLVLIDPEKIADRTAQGATRRQSAPKPEVAPTSEFITKAEGALEPERAAASQATPETAAAPEPAPKAEAATEPAFLSETESAIAPQAAHETKAAIKSEAVPEMETGAEAELLPEATAAPGAASDLEAVEESERAPAAESMPEVVAVPPVPALQATVNVVLGDAPEAHGARQTEPASEATPDATATPETAPEAEVAAQPAPLSECATESAIAPQAAPEAEAALKSEIVPEMETGAEAELLPEATAAPGAASDLEAVEESERAPAAESMPEVEAVPPVPASEAILAAVGEGEHIPVDDIVDHTAKPFVPEEYFPLPAVHHSGGKPPERWNEPADSIVKVLSSRSISVVIEAPGGQGKTALLREVLRRAVRNFENDPTQPLPVLCEAPKGTIEETLEAALHNYRLPTKCLTQMLRDGNLFLCFDRAENINEFSKKIEEIPQAVPVLFATRSAEALPVSRTWLRVIPQSLTTNTAEEFVKHYCKVDGIDADQFPAQLYSSLRSHDGKYIPIFLRLAVLAVAKSPDPGSIHSVAEVYKAAFRRLAHEDADELLDQTAARALDVYWQTEASLLPRTLPHSAAPVDVKALQTKLMASGMLVASGRRGLDDDDPDTVRFFHDSFLSFLTAHGLYRREEWSALSRAAGDSRFLDSGRSELFSMCLHVFSSETEKLRSSLADQLRNWRGNRKVVRRLSEELILNSLPPELRTGPLADDDKQSVGKMLDRAIEAAEKADDGDGFTNVAVLFQGLAPIAYPASL